MNLFKVFGFLVVIGITLGGCNMNHSPNVDHIQLEVNPIPFYDDLFSLNTDSIAQQLPALQAKYGLFLEGYTQQVIKIGSTTDPNFPQYLKKFLEYESNQDVISKCRAEYADASDVSHALTDAFKHYKYYFPKKQIPQIYFHISGFNQSIVVDSSLVSISIEKYLGSDCEFYDWLAVPVYMRKGMVRQKMAPDVMRAIAITDFSQQMKNDDVINNMVQKGKSLYFIKQMMPELSDTLLFDYTKEQLAWSEKNEADLWAGLVERKHVFNNERLIIQKYVGDSPFTYYFGQESPGRGGAFIGYKIIESYMAHHTEVTLNELMGNNDGRLIMNQAYYRP